MVLGMAFVNNVVVMVVVELVMAFVIVVVVVVGLMVVVFVLMGEMGIKTDGEGTADPRNTDGDVPDTSFEECRHLLVFEIGNV